MTETRSRLILTSTDTSPSMDPNRPKTDKEEPGYEESGRFEDKSLPLGLISIP